MSSAQAIRSMYEREIKTYQDVQKGVLSTFGLTPTQSAVRSDIGGLQTQSQQLTEQIQENVMVQAELKCLDVSSSTLARVQQQ